MATFEVNEKGQVVAILTKGEQQRALAAQRLGFVANVAPARPKPKTRAEMKAGNGYPCSVNTACKWTGRTFERSATHATRDTLQAAGHLEIL